MCRFATSSSWGRLIVGFSSEAASIASLLFGQENRAFNDFRQDGLFRLGANRGVPITAHVPEASQAAVPIPPTRREPRWRSLWLLKLGITTSIQVSQVTRSVPKPHPSVCQEHPVSPSQSTAASPRAALHCIPGGDPEKDIASSEACVSYAAISLFDCSETDHETASLTRLIVV